MCWKEAKEMSWAGGGGKMCLEDIYEGAKQCCNRARKDVSGEYPPPSTVYRDFLRIKTRGKCPLLHPL